MLTAYLTHPDCERHQMGPDHPECPERLAVLNDHLLIKGLLDCMQAEEAPEVTDEQLLRVHCGLWLAQLQALSPASGYARLDADTLVNAYTLRAARRAAGAAVRAVDLVMSGQAPNAFCAVRPPGHHAKRSTGGGFCFFNNAAVGVAHALAVHGVQRVALVDFDVHHGDGSEDIWAGDDRVLLCSSYQHDLYPFRDAAPPASNVVLAPLPARSGGGAMREAVSQHWLPALQRFEPELLVISAGFDAHREDDMGNLGWSESDYQWVTEQLLQQARASARGRIVSCLEGGYSLSALARSAGAHVRVLVEA
ncbi:histone deacetylase family protein [Inhella gelatinilytica]|uniref:Histone deacetylase family protein n=1 Tax=Inhella gelatinilytica TaxID=2795030 RepID=A0A931ND74_9BURK|nr:histone deacetylase family protein [Inhella gelatinilytica]MBH9552304.1 histone deacetylase family protein [Inhella gelatinilytica]